MVPTPREILRAIADPFFLLLRSGGLKERATLLPQWAHRYLYLPPASVIRLVLVR